MEDDEIEPTTEAAPTTTTEVSTTLGPGECPGPDESYCSCGRIKDVNRPFPHPWPFPMTQSDDNKIVGGQEAEPHAYPWQVALTYYDYQVILAVKNGRTKYDFYFNWFKSKICLI